MNRHDRRRSLPQDRGPSCAPSSPGRAGRVEEEALLGTGRLLAEALEELAALPADAWEKSLASPILVHFGLVTHRQARAHEEAEVSAEIREWFKGYEQKQRATERKQRAKGRTEGRAEEAARAVLTVLRVRGIAVPEAARERVVAQKDPSLLERWLEKAAVADSVAEVLDTPS